MTATNPGTVAIEIDYARPWEQAAPENTFTLTLNIAAEQEIAEYTLGEHTAL